MRSTPVVARTATSRTVESRDGTAINYRSVGEGPGVVVVPGALSTADDYAALASALAVDFSVHTIERRGRGLSGPQGDRYGIGRECEDLAAVRAQTGARYLVGHSFGGLVALEAARNDPALTKIAVYEPGVSVDGLISMSWIPEYQRCLARGEHLDAFTEFCIAAGPAMAQKTPRWMMKLGLRLAIRGPRRQKIFQLLPANLGEHREVSRLDNTYENYREVLAPTLLMFGGKSDFAWLTAAVERLTDLLPTATTREFPALDHFGPDQKGPAEIAQAVRQYFLE
jgi:pimeloyl-ACP methyl ester carboxylesterase